MKPAHISWWQYLRYGLGRRLSMLGERLGVEALVYNPLVMLKFHEESSRNATKTAPAILAYFPEAECFLDVGSGSGAFAAELQRRGRRVVACERSRVGRTLAARQGVDCRAFDLTQSPSADVSGQFNVVTCFEVAEHVPEALGDKLIEFICAHADNVVFTAAHPGQGGTGHINEQPKAYWIEKFEGEGFRYRPDASATLSAAFNAAGAAAWFGANVCVFAPRARDGEGAA